MFLRFCQRSRLGPCSIAPGVGIGPRRGRPVVSHRVIVDLISATTTDTGLTVYCELDTDLYPKGIVVSDEEMAALNIVRAEFHGEWNYTIRPSNRSGRSVDWP